MKVGITERGDASLDLRWVNKLSEVDGAILITKNITDKFIEAVLIADKPIIVHATCTGWGGSIIEPNVPRFTEQLHQLQKLLDKGFPKQNVVLRVDPIIPVENGFTAMKHVLDKALEMYLLSDMRVRISVLDNYPHVRERFKQANIQPLYNGYFKPPMVAIDDLYYELSLYAEKGIVFETCAEKELQDRANFIKGIGCISNEDLRIMGLPLCSTQTQGFQRSDCLCLGGIKYELLTSKTRCPHKCIYCYWKD